MRSEEEKMKEKTLETEYNGELTLKKKKEKLELRAGEKIVYSRKVKDSKYSGGYWDYLATATGSEKPSKILVIGLGCGTIARALKNLHKDVTIHGVEIDKKVIEIGKKWFNLDEHVDEIFLEDGENYLDQNNEEYDYIVIDCFVKSSIPLHMCTPRFMKKLRKNLSTKGTISFNTIKEKDTIEIKKNMEKYMEEVKKIKIPKLHNIILIGKKKPGGKN